MFAQGQWGGIHAVYNIYNATRLMEFINWAKEVKIDTHWQSLYQPDYLDPLKHTPAVRELAHQELKRVLARTDLTDSERSFFTQAEQNFNNTPTEDLTEQFKQHIQEMENKYHRDQQGQFARLWPELADK